MKKLKLGIIGGGPGSWIGHVHRIASDSMISMKL